MPAFVFASGYLTAILHSVEDTIALLLTAVAVLYMTLLTFLLISEWHLLDPRSYLCYLRLLDYRHTLSGLRDC